MWLDPDINATNLQWWFPQANDNYLATVDQAGQIKVLEPYQRDYSGATNYLVPTTTPYNFIGRSISKAVQSDRDSVQGVFPHRYYPIPRIPAQYSYGVSTYS